MAKIEGLERLQAKLQAMKARADEASSASVVVGYAAAYAVWVHENLEAIHKVGQAKYLEQPFRQMRAELAEIVLGAVRKGKTMAQALLLAGLRLQRESQLLVPVDTGNLRASAFTRLEE